MKLGESNVTDDPIKTLRKSSLFMAKELKRKLAEPKSLVLFQICSYMYACVHYIKLTGKDRVPLSLVVRMNNDIVEHILILQILPGSKTFNRFNHLMQLPSKLVHCNKVSPNFCYLSG